MSLQPKASMKPIDWKHYMLPLQHHVWLWWELDWLRKRRNKSLSTLNLVSPIKIVPKKRDPTTMKISYKTWLILERSLNKSSIGCVELNYITFLLYYISVSPSHLYYFMFNISRYDCKVYFEEYCTQDDFLYHHNNYLHSMFTTFLNTNSFYFAYNSNITGNVTVQCSPCAKRWHGQQPF